MSRPRGKTSGAGQQISEQNMRIFGHCFLQSLMEKGYLLESDAKELFKRICSVETGNQLMQSKIIYKSWFEI
jgi:hypothetical protein